MASIMTTITGGKPTSEPLLLKTDIQFTKSVVHHCIQNSARDLNAALGITDEALLDQFLATDAGKKWTQGFREYAVFVLSKTV
ncbi:MAG: hypothetical protein E6Q97_32595 [Desulfurellales bacterium]|nr:MAG: hypothetical protein E6Q97_32595 [Desulfurellales bacterium]